MLGLVKILGAEAILGMTHVSPDEWQELRAIVEDGYLHFDAATPDRLVLTLAHGLDCDWSFGVMIDCLIDSLQNADQVSDARALAKFLERKAKQLLIVVDDMEEELT